MKRRRVLLRCLAIVVTAGLALAVLGRYAKRHVESVNCGNYMASIGFAARVWALDNGGHLPFDFRSMSNELSTPLVLVCPSDHQRIPAKDFSFLDQTNCSYEIVAPGLTDDDTTNIYFRCKVHGHLGYADGTVFDGRRRRTKILW